MKQLMYVIGLIVVLSLVFRALLFVVPVVLAAAIVVALLFLIDKSPKKVK